MLEQVATRLVSATEFKAKCLALLDEMERGGEPITITRRGRPVAVLAPPKKTAWKSPANSWAGRMTILGDIMAGTSEIWDVVNGREPEDRSLTLRPRLLL